MKRFPLVCHPATPCPVDLTLSVSLSAWHEDGEPRVQLDFEATGEVQRLRIPVAVASPSQADGLWKHSCFESFMANAQGTGYQEFNCAPSGQWAHYHFASERQREEQRNNPSASGIAVALTASSLHLSARLPVQMPSDSLQWGFTAVLELEDGSLSYWALHHPKPQPDFHNRGGWTVQWPPSAA